jgi:hypothetical protein
MGLLGAEGLFGKSRCGVFVVIRSFAKHNRCVGSRWGVMTRNIDWKGNNGSVSEQQESNWFIMADPPLHLPALSSPGQDNGIIPLFINLVSSSFVDTISFSKINDFINKNSFFSIVLTAHGPNFFKRKQNNSNHHY